MRIVKLISFAILLFSQANFSEVRYVSKTGNSTPPYLSWETASDSIQKCINISNFGDTIYVGNGEYKEKVVMIPGLALIGAGMDSCVIDVIELAPWQPRGIEMKDSCIVKGFKLLFDPYTLANGSGIFMSFTDSIKGCIVINNYIMNAFSGIYVTEGIVKHNFIYKSNRGINCAIFDESRQYIAYIDSNYISFSFIGIQVGEGTIINATNNIFKIEGEFETDGEILYNALSGSSTPNFSNNVIVKSKYDLYYRTGISNSYPGSFTNNLFIAKFKNVFYSVPVTIINNNIIESQNAVYGGGSDVKYNNFWKVSSYPSDSTNISADPMFVNDTSDFHLQMYSPLIDAGDPIILDIDGSRSDIGLFGGPHGEKYTYRDLAPRPPKNLTAVYDNKSITLRWNRNTEADFSHYHIYRDTEPDFMYDSSKIIGVTTDTIFLDNVNNLKYNPESYYYKVTSWDSTSHQSAPGNEVGVLLTGQAEIPPKVIEEYKLLNNYPNPFNPTTTIPYILKESGYVKLVIYKMLGERVKVLVNGYQNKGYHEAEFTPNSEEREKGSIGEGYWTGYNDDMATGIYIYWIDVKNDNNIPVYVNSGKMILLK